MTNRLAAVVLAAVSLVVAPITWAQSDEPVAISIDQSQPLSDALQSFADQTDLQVIFFADITEGKVTSGLDGEYPVDAALDTLLADTGLSYTFIDDSAVSVQASSNDSGGDSDSKNSQLTPVLMAQNQTRGQPTQTVDADQANQQGQESRIPLEEIIVTGSRLVRTGEGALPGLAFDSDDIARTGVTTVGQLFGFIPQASLNNDESGANTFLGASSPQLRGLSLGSTLVLINGRRVAISGAQSANNIFDLNSIPIAAIERVEVITASGSAIYGADALAGVVNIILKDDLDDLSLSARYGVVSDSDSDDIRISAAFGKSVEKAGFTLTFDYYHREPLFGADRTLTADNDYTRFGSADGRTQVSLPPTVLGADGTPIQENLTSYGQFSSIVPETTRIGLTASGNYEFSSKLRATGEFMFSRNEQERVGGPDFDFVFVPPDNQFNTFGAPVLVARLLPELGRTTDSSETDFFRFLVGVDGKINDHWEWSSSVLYIHDENHVDKRNYVNIPNFQTLVASEQVNPFVEISDPTLVDQFRLDNSNDAESDLYQIDAMIRGDLFELPGGQVQVVAGFEYREEEIFVRNGNTLAEPDGSVISEYLSSDGTADGDPLDRDVMAMYVETLLPLVEPEMGILGAHKLELIAAIRHDNYSDFGGTTNPQVSIRWFPIEDLFLRAQYGTAFKPPSLSQLYLPPIQFDAPPTTTDPLTGNILRVLGGGNPNLEPEESDNYSIGLVFTPTVRRDLRMSIDYFSIDQDNRVQRFNPLTILDNESVFPGRIDRTSVAGITIIDATNLNFGAVRVSGLDFLAEFAVSLGAGELSSRLGITHTLKYETELLPGAGSSDRAGVANREGFAPEWKGAANVSYSRGGLTSGIAIRYISSYDDYRDDFRSVERTVDDSVVVDWQIGYKFDQRTDSPLSGTYVTAGIVNLFDEEPPFAQRSFTAGYDPSQHDIRGRSYYVEIGKRFD